jgi:hypothetical protein
VFAVIGRGFVSDGGSIHLINLFSAGPGTHAGAVSGGGLSLRREEAYWLDLFDEPRGGFIKQKLGDFHPEEIAKGRCY